MTKKRKVIKVTKVQEAKNILSYRAESLFLAWKRESDKGEADELYKEYIEATSHINGLYFLAGYTGIELK